MKPTKKPMWVRNGGRESINYREVKGVWVVKQMMANLKNNGEDHLFLVYFVGY